MVRSTACPECKARAGSYCRGPKGPRLSNHMGRVIAHKRQREDLLPVDPVASDEDEDGET